MVDAINGSSERLNIQEILGISSVTRSGQTTAGESALQSDKAQFSLIGQLVSTAKSQGASDEDLEAFRIKIMDAIKNGNFNAEALAQEAPDALKQAAEETGIDLTSALESMAEQVESRQAMRMPPPPPPPAEDESQEESEDTAAASEIMELVDAARAAGASEEDLEEFREIIMEAIQRGNFDAEALAAQAPDALKDAAKTNDIDLASALQSMAEDMESRRGMVPPPPPPQQDRNEDQLLQ